MYFIWQIILHNSLFPKDEDFTEFEIYILPARKRQKRNQFRSI